MAPHPTRPKGAEESQGTRRRLGPSGLKEGRRCPGLLYQRENSETVLLGSSTPLGLKGLLLGSLTAVTTTRKKGRRDLPADSLSTLTEVKQPQPLLVAAWLGTAEPLLRPALGLLGHAQPSNVASGLGLRPHPWPAAPPPQPLEAASALSGLSPLRPSSALWARL